MGLGFLTQSSGDEKLMRFKDKKQIVFVDLEVGVGNRRICDVGAARRDGATLHSSDLHLLGISKDFIGDNDL